jgi:hypothetical protein
MELSATRPKTLPFAGPGDGSRALGVVCSPRWAKTILRIGPAVILAAFAGGGAVRGQAVDEYQLKAAFLSNFAKFVEWPPASFSSPQDPIVICILGVDPFGDALRQAVNGKMIEDRKPVVHQISDVRQAGGCSILFISSSERKRLRAILAEIKTNGILTVGDTGNFAVEGGVINLKLEGGRVRLQINLDAADRQKLRISAKLLSLAQIVKN